MEQYEKIAVMGLGSAGRATVNDIKEHDIENVKLIAVKDDAPPLSLETSLAGTDMLFMAAAPGEEGFSNAIAYASTAWKMGILTFGFALVPQNYEMNGVKSFQNAVDAVMPVLDYEDASRVVKFISDLINKAGFINLNFSDIRPVLFNAGYVCFGTGIGTGENRSEQAARNALRSLSEYTSPEDVARMIMGISSGPNVTFTEILDAVDAVKETAASDAHIAWSHIIDETAGESFRVNLLAAGSSK